MDRAEFCFSLAQGILWKVFWKRLRDQDTRFVPVPLHLSRKCGEIMKTAGISVHNLKDQFIHLIFKSLSCPAADRGKLLQESVTIILMCFLELHILSRTRVCPVFFVRCPVFHMTHILQFLKINQW